MCGPCTITLTVKLFAMFASSGALVVVRSYFWR